jgi:hypothetical protein
MIITLIGKVRLPSHSQTCSTTFNFGEYGTIIAIIRRHATKRPPLMEVFLVYYNVLQAKLLTACTIVR